MPRQAQCWEEFIPQRSHWFDYSRSCDQFLFLHSPAVADAKARVGDFPFTTIEPNVGVSFVNRPCACARFQKSAECKPRHGTCKDGVRAVPIKILDVAGLVPGASEGLGLGNQFLDDLCGAHVLLHIIDASGTTNEKGENTSGYKLR